MPYPISKRTIPPTFVPVPDNTIKIKYKCITNLEHYLLFDGAYQEGISYRGVCSEL